MKTKLVLFSLLVALIVVSVGCAKTFSEEDVKSFAHPLTEMALVAFDTSDFAAIAPTFTEDMQAALPESQFLSLAKQLKELIGDYVRNSIKYVSASQKGTIITVLYEATYTNDSPVQITISFEQVAGEYKIAGIYFNSAKIRGK